MQLFQHLKWFFRQHRFTYALALSMLFAVAMLNMAVPWFIGRAIDKLLETRDFSQAEFYLFALLGVSILVYLLRYGWRRVLFGTSYQLGNILREQFYHRLLRQGQAFYNQHSTGDLMARATNDIDAVEMAAGEGILSGFDGLMTFILVLVMMFVFIDWQLAVLAILPFPFMGYGFYKLSNRIHHQFKDTLDSFSTLNEQAQQSVAGIRMIKSMGREAIEADKFERIAEQSAQSTYKVQRSEALFDPIIQLSLGAALLIALLMGGWQISSGNLTVGQLTSFTLYLSELIWPMYAFGWLMNILQRGNAAIGRLEELLNLPDSINDQGTTEPAGYALAIEHVSFHYPETGQPSLSNISLQLGENRVLGIAGATGAGKSTLLHLLMRYWEAEQGSIEVSGIPIQSIPLPALRNLYAYVPQDAFLFSMSIMENIRIGRSEASDEDVHQAAKLAAIHDDILQFPEGYQTLVGERGVTLSGGQRQRISIARALISQAPILVLDDALSAVDIKTEKVIIEHLQQRREQTLIVVSHRLSAIERADEIVVLAHGEMIEKGTHRELIRQDGWYARMAAYQQMEQALENDLQ
ncbi:ABC transporter ATP-binding protein [Vibrio fluvialis]|uniref:Multidrug resistance-like ATP-binding protein MdlA n=1 Tax=Vibrio fluvialis PG41 TaxID=1336752 RepID=S7JQU6_VIBFL|nr:ABC transporter transmembrane domain-containing protein [Vibrio fluvialis]EPP24575.1 ABC transporter, ATP-binding/permease protein [Vibrio fluvialis PG41]EPP25584.1 ABC transporter, ATP-binding/permease protein [Vibrio fluvialis I21563]MBY7805615.1 ATP-binding cassette domain-containing protein [Vibrio fluvialis]MBY7840714.1 ATP-binding cassette domain-containing protein [Vibrio fluvialis]MBY7861879.1 ATP-binding cassette domain-containing protein [Vibrio fluvialis]